jgi:hypothetical protein
MHVPLNSLIVVGVSMITFFLNPYKFELNQLITSNIGFLARNIPRERSPRKASLGPSALGMLSSGHAPRVVSR